MENSANCSGWDQSSYDYLALLNQWHIVAKSVDIIPEAPFQVKLLGLKLVVWRGSEGLNAWADNCPHRGAQLSDGKVIKDKIICPYHGWEYNEKGERVHVPAHPEIPCSKQSLVQRFSIRELYGFVWVCIGKSHGEIPRLPHWDSVEYKKCFTGPYHFSANALRCIDNFIDASHFPHIHSGINGLPNAPDTTIDYRVIEENGEICTTGFSVVQPDADARGIQLTVDYRYYCVTPTVAYSDKRTGPGEHWFTWAAVTPIDIDQSIIWLVMCFNHKDEISDKQIEERQSRIFEEGDKWIVESQQPVRLPLNPTDELHVKSDRLGVAYRKWIMNMGKEAHNNKKV